LSARAGRGDVVQVGWVCGGVAGGARIKRLDTSRGGPISRPERKHGFSTEQFPVSAYVGSSKNLKDLKDPRRARPITTREHQRGVESFTEENIGPHVPWAYTSLCGRDLCKVTPVILQGVVSSEGALDSGERGTPFLRRDLTS